MTIEEILAGESKNVEFKENLPEKSIKYMKSVVAFAMASIFLNTSSLSKPTTSLVLSAIPKMIFPQASRYFF